MFNKIAYYSNPRLLDRLVFAWMMLGLVSCLKGSHIALRLLPGVRSSRLNYGREKITRYVKALLSVLRHCGFSATCLNYSILLCYLLRWAGFEATINFGACKDKPASMPWPSLTGHCWVTVEDEAIEDSYQILCSYP